MTLQPERPATRELPAGLGSGLPTDGIPCPFHRTQRWLTCRAFQKLPFGSILRFPHCLRLLASSQSSTKQQLCAPGSARELCRRTKRTGGWSRLQTALRATYEKKNNSLRLVCFSFWWRVYSFKWKKKFKEKQIKDVPNLEFVLTLTHTDGMFTVKLWGCLCRYTRGEDLKDCRLGRGDTSAWCKEAFDDKKFTTRTLGQSWGKTFTVKT